MHTDSVNQNDNVLIIDDLLATGGTVEATIKLIQRLGGKVEHAAFVISLPELAVKSAKIRRRTFTLVDFAGH